MFHKEDFGETVLPNCLNDSKAIDIATYNFKHKGEISFYNKLRQLANKYEEVGKYTTLNNLGELD